MTALKRRALGVLVAVASILTVVVTPAFAAAEAPADWVLQENVDLSDSSRWVAETGQASNTSSYDLPSNVTFSKAGITVHGAAQAHGTAKYTSGDAKGTGIRIPNYARVEAKGSVPFGSGLWPALMWLRPLDSANGEIDLMEVFGPDARVAATLHNEYGATHRSLQGSAKWASLPVPSPTASHTYVMEKTPDRIRISVDGTVILDAGPQNVRAGFDWDAIFERPGAVWYPRVTLQIGCAASDPQCGIGLPSPGWQGGDVKLTSLRIWKLAGDPAQTSQLPSPSGIPETPMETSTSPALGAPAPATEPAPALAPTPRTPAGSAPVPSTPATAFALTPGHEERRLVKTGPSTSKAAVAFVVPQSLGTGVLYQSVQLPLAHQSSSGYRVTVEFKPSGSLYLSLSWASGNRTRVLSQSLVAKRGSYLPGAVVHVALAVHEGRVSAKAWVPQKTGEPGWQLNAAATVRPSSLSGLLVIGYLSKVGPPLLRAPWQVVSN